MSRRARRDKQRGRRALDYRAMMSLNGTALRVVPYVGRGEAESALRATEEQGVAGEVTMYDVTCLSPLPVSRTESVSGITTRFDISDPNYPIEPPAAVVTSPQKPFTPHVHPPSGFICLGNLWKELGGKELLAELVTRVVHAYNYQDPPAGEPAFQPAALSYRESLRGRPFDSNLVLPAIPEDVYELRTAVGGRPKVSILSSSVRMAETPSARARVTLSRASRVPLITVRRS